MAIKKKYKLDRLAHPHIIVARRLKENLSEKDVFMMKFWRKLKEDRLFLISFIITIGFLTIFFLIKWNQDELKGKDNSLQNVYVETEDGLSKDDASNSTDSNISLKDYVGIYSRDVNLNDTLEITDSCKIESYKIIYNVTKNDTIEKYFYSSCVGTIKLWEDGVTYKEDGGVRYITSNNTFFKFLGDSLKEIKGDEILKYDVDYSINSLKDKLLLDDSINLYFYGENVVFLKKDNLLLLSGKKVMFNANDNYVNNGGNLDVRFYKAKRKYTFKFIVFSNKENVACYEEKEVNENFEDGELYTIYKVSYDVEKGEFGNVEKLVTRNKLDSCQYYDEDMNLLKS